MVVGRIIIKFIPLGTFIYNSKDTILYRLVYTIRDASA